ncbi:hemolysin III family protein [Shewanella sp. ULN5]|uniref:Hemolysin III family protein n=1 Tax=Shewanella holmiensis TaxID=2952222 RepID=A0A9X3AVT5_9GAMM|nr:MULTISPECIES: hemolysin III family protein [Shewanella]MCT7942995.1 hemolysin III family protein [Shewanella holmiensis]MDP5148320.1 hemolysin III family protein [Shewanella sp. ULN5]
MAIASDTIINDSSSNSTSDYSVREELANTISHGLGVLAGIVGLAFMLINARDDLSAVQLTGITIYGISIILLFLASTLYHSSRTAVWRKRFKMADHCAIYTLIAGTYTPLMLITLQNDNALTILTAIWCLALGGIVFKTLFIGRFKAFSLLLYLLMGWLCVTVMHDLIANMSQTSFNLLISGGLSYSLGVIFYANKKIPYNHAIWHLFVLGGAFTHFFSIYLVITH